MIRFFAVTLWQLLDVMGYQWVLRLDDDSLIESRWDASWDVSCSAQLSSVLLLPQDFLQPVSEHA
jgi:hypothetical protein